MEKDKYIYLNEISLHFIDSLITNSISREVVDSWFVFSYLPFEAEVEEYLLNNDPALLELIQCFGMVTIPDAKNGYLYQKSDFKLWKKTYLDAKANDKSST